MRATPQGNRIHIGVVGRRNVGKSSLLNALVRQDVAVVSDTPGTTTDPVHKPMELAPLGPVLLVDTAGVDDEGSLGSARVAKTRKVFERVDVALIVCETDRWGEAEEALLAELTTRGAACVAVLSKADLASPDPALLARLRDRGTPVVVLDAPGGRGLDALRGALVEAVPDELLAPPALAADLVPPGGLAVLVVPIDKEAPAGRLILPQVQTIRDLLDGDAACLVVKERELRSTLDRLGGRPDLVVTDSQAFLKVAADTPEDVPMTSFSILFARAKGDLPSMVQGAAAIDRLRPGDPVLVAEACSHHAVTEDIGRVKIPRWLTSYVGGALRFDHVQGRDFPDDPSPWRLVIHCGACMWNRRAMLSRIMACQACGVPVTNYGLVIAASLGIMERALGPFPDALDAWRRASGPLVGVD